MGDIGMHSNWSSRPKSCRLKFIVMSPEIFVECMNLKKSNILSISKGIQSKNVHSTVSSNLPKCEVKRQQNEQLEFHSFVFHSD